MSAHVLLLLLLLLLLSTLYSMMIWNNMWLKILWEMEHLLQKSKHSIFHNIFKSIQNLT